jgi:Transposase
VRTVYQHGAAPPAEWPARSGWRALFPVLLPRRDEGGDVLGVGIDWAEEFHLVALGRTDQGIIEVVRVEHRPQAVSALVARIAGFEPDPADVRVLIETRHRLLVEALVAAGYTVLPVNPELVSRRRGPARKKDDAEDAGSAACWRWTGTPGSSGSSRTASSPVRCARSPATTSGPAGTSGGCSTGCAPTCSPPSRPRSPSPARTSARPGCCGCWNAGPPPRRWPQRPALPAATRLVAAGPSPGRG